MKDCFDFHLSRNNLCHRSTSPLIHKHTIWDYHSRWCISNLLALVVWGAHSAEVNHDLDTHNYKPRLKHTQLSTIITGLLAPNFLCNLLYYFKDGRNQSWQIVLRLHCQKLHFIPWEYTMISYCVSCSIYFNIASLAVTFVCICNFFFFS